MWKTEAILQFEKIKASRPSLAVVKCLHLKIELLLQVFRALEEHNGIGGEQRKSKNKQGCHPVTLLSLIYYLTVT